MDYSSVFQSIGSLGFPIVAAIGCFVYMTKLNEMHREEISELRKTIENNTNVLTRFLERSGDN